MANVTLTSPQMTITVEISPTAEKLVELGTNPSGRSSINALKLLAGAQISLFEKVSPNEATATTTTTAAFDPNAQNVQNNQYQGQNMNQPGVFPDPNPSNNNQGQYGQSARFAQGQYNPAQYGQGYQGQQTYQGQNQGWHGPHGGSNQGQYGQYGSNQGQNQGQGQYGGQYGSPQSVDQYGRQNNPNQDGYSNDPYGRHGNDWRNQGQNFGAARGNVVDTILRTLRDAVAAAEKAGTDYTA